MEYNGGYGVLDDLWRSEMKIVVDYDLCESNQVCVKACPEVFSINEDDELMLSTETPDPSLREKLERAVRGCPRQALRLEET